jgi:hypothetical protein
MEDCVDIDDKQYNAQKSQASHENSSNNHNSKNKACPNPAPLPTILPLLSTSIDPVPIEIDAMQTICGPLT